MWDCLNKNSNFLNDRVKCINFLILYLIKILEVLQRSKVNKHVTRGLCVPNYIKAEPNNSGRPTIPHLVCLIELLSSPQSGHSPFQGPDWAEADVRCWKPPRSLLNEKCQINNLWKIKLVQIKNLFYEDYPIRLLCCLNAVLSRHSIFHLLGRIRL